MLDERNWFALQTKVNPIFDPLRGDPRFEALIQKSLPERDKADRSQLTLRFAEGRTCRGWAPCPRGFPTV